MSDLYEKALRDVQSALYEFSSRVGAAAHAIINTEPYEESLARQALGEQGAALDAHSLVTKMLTDYRRSVKA